MNQKQLLEAVQKKLSITRDEDLAIALSVSQPMVSKVRSGVANVGPETAMRIAEILDVDPAKVAAAAYAARANLPETRKKWEKAAALTVAISVGAKDILRRATDELHRRVKRPVSVVRLTNRTRNRKVRVLTERHSHAAHRTPSRTKRLTRLPHV